MAVGADPANQRAVADFPLIALKAGRAPEAVAAADIATTTLTSASGRASAWFNEALGCDQIGRSFVEYAGNVYCTIGEIGMFLRSYKLEASAARANKLRDQFPKIGPNACTVTATDGSVSRYGFGKSFVSKDGKTPGIAQEIYVLHPASVTADLTMIGTVSPTAWTPRIVDRVVLGDDAITVIEAPFTMPPHMIAGRPCGQ